MSAILNIVIYIFLLIFSDNTGQSEDVAISTRLSQSMCRKFEESKFERVLPSPGPSSVCPVFEKEGSSNIWTFNNCQDGPNNMGSSNYQSESTGDRSRNENGESRLVNGKDAPPFSHPYLVYIRKRGEGLGFCGTIYNKYTILTNAWELDTILKKVASIRELQVHIGKHRNRNRENEEQIRLPCGFTHHPDYRLNSNNQAFFAYTVLHLSDPITFNNYADKIPIGDEFQKQGYRCPCLVPSWGSNSPQGSIQTPDTMQEANATLAQCPSSISFQENQNCSNPIFCFGDSASPAVCTYNDRINVAALVAGVNPSYGGGVKCDGIGRTLYDDLRIPKVYQWAEKAHQDRTNCRKCGKTEYA